MSFAGHVFDMIRRNKELRDMHNLRRERTRDSQRRYGASLQDSKITAEEMQEINQKLKIRETQQQDYFSRMEFLILGIMVVIIVLLCVIFKHFIA